MFGDISTTSTPSEEGAAEGGAATGSADGRRSSVRASRHGRERRTAE
jgi:hypothetical protein